MYFERPGIENTERTLEIAFDFATRRGINDIVIASTTGYVAEMVLKKGLHRGRNVVIVTHNVGFREEGVSEFPEGLRERLQEEGIRVHTSTMALRGVGTAIRELLSYSEQEIIANTLRIFGQGVKVCVEIAAMAADAGLIHFSDCVSIAGTGRGADTALLIRASSSNRFFKIKVREVIVKPREF
jgi:hypothetical protein